MILSDQDIRKELDSGRLVIQNLKDLEVQLQPSSLDVRLSNEFSLLKRPPGASSLKVDEDSTSWFKTFHQDCITLLPKDFLLASTIEYVKVPDDMVVQVEGRSSLGRLGIIVHATAGYIDPGFEGNITLEMCNLSPVPIQLKADMRIGQLVFHKMSSPAEKPYGPDRGSKYGGSQGVVPSKIHLDD